MIDPINMSINISELNFNNTYLEFVNHTSIAGKGMILEAGQKYSYELIVKNLCANFSNWLILLSIIINVCFIIERIITIYAIIMEKRHPGWRANHPMLAKVAGFFDWYVSYFALVIAGYVLYIQYFS